MPNYDVTVYGVREFGAQVSVEVVIGGALLDLFQGDADVRFFVPPFNGDGFAPGVGPDYTDLQVDTVVTHRLVARDGTFNPAAPSKPVPKLEAACIANSGTYTDLNA